MLFRSYAGAIRNYVLTRENVIPVSNHIGRRIPNKQMSRVPVFDILSINQRHANLDVQKTTVFNWISDDLDWVDRLVSERELCPWVISKCFGD